MRNNTQLLTVLDRMEDGPIMMEKDFDRLITATIRELCKKYQLKYDRCQAIVTDDALADRFFDAGLELACTTGIFCTDTHARITFTREEIAEHLRWAPAELTIGAGRDACTIHSRRPEDSRVPTVIGGAFGSPISEELYSVVMESYAQERVVDSIVGGNYLTVHGRTPKTHSPWEVLLAWREIEHIKSACARAGRPGLAVGVVENSVSEIGELSGTSIGGFPQTDWHHVCFVSELKTNYSLLIKVAHLVKTDCIIHSFYNPILGGYAGGAEGMAVAAVAGIILESMVNCATTCSICPTHPFYNCNTDPAIIWGISAAQQAINRNTNLLTTVMTSPVSGPLTESLLYECAAQATNVTVSGVSRVDGVRSAVGVELNHVSGLEVRFNGEVAHAAAGMSRKDAEPLIREFQKHYVPVIDQKPIGKAFPEVYDVVTVRPKPEWEAMYQKVKGELARLGLSLAY